VDPRCGGNIVELYCDLLEDESESGRNIVSISVLQSIYECVFVYLVKRLGASYSNGCSLPFDIQRTVHRDIFL
jgi:hypothetical protein